MKFTLYDRLANEKEKGKWQTENGQYTEELTLVISMIDVQQKIVNEIAQNLCVFFRQESVMITEGRVRAYFINKSLEDFK